MMIKIFKHQEKVLFFYIVMFTDVEESLIQTALNIGRFMAAYLPAKSSRQPQLSLENNKKSARFSPAGTDFYECGHCGQVSLMD